jgi:uncharacterized protein YbjQ (UPF0145 family)
VEVDDEQAEDALAALRELGPPPGLSLVSTAAPLPCIATGAPMAASPAHHHHAHHPGGGGKSATSAGAGTPSCGPVLLPLEPLPLAQLPALLPARPGSSGGGAAPAVRLSLSQPRSLRLVVLVLRVHWRDLASGAPLLGAPGVGGGGSGSSASGSGGEYRFSVHDSQAATSDTDGGGGGDGIARQHSSSHYAAGGKSVPPGLSAATAGDSVAAAVLGAGLAGAGSAGGNSWYGSVAQAFGFGAASPAAFPDAHHPGHHGSVSSLHSGGGTATPAAAAAAAAGAALPPAAAAPTTDSDALSRLFHAAYGLLAYHLRALAPVTVAGLRSSVGIPEPDVLELVVTGHALREAGMVLLPPPAPMSGGGDGADADGSAAEALPLVAGPGAALQLALPGGYPACMRSYAPPSLARHMLARMVAHHNGLRQEAVLAAGWATAALAAAAAAAARPRTPLLAPSTPLGGGGGGSSTPLVLAGAQTPGGATTTSSASMPPSPFVGGTLPPPAIGGGVGAASPQRHNNSNWHGVPDILLPASAAALLDGSIAGASRQQPARLSFARQLAVQQQQQHGAGPVSTLPPPPPATPTAAAAGTLNRDVELTPLPALPGRRVVRYAGCIACHFVRESLLVGVRGGGGGGSAPGGGGLSGFTQALLAEAHAVVRAQAAALGANAVVNYRLTPRESSLRASAAYHLVSVSGDAVELEEL